MQTIAQGYKGVSTLVTLNWDRLFMTAALIGALYAGTFVALM